MTKNIAASWAPTVSQVGYTPNHRPSQYGGSASIGVMGIQPVPCIVRAVCPTITTRTKPISTPVTTSIVSARPSPAPSSTVTAPALSSSDCRKSTVSKPSR